MKPKVSEVTVTDEDRVLLKDLRLFMTQHNFTNREQRRVFCAIKNSLMKGWDVNVDPASRLRMITAYGWDCEENGKDIVTTLNSFLLSVKPTLRKGFGGFELEEKNYKSPSKNFHSIVYCETDSLLFEELMEILNESELNATDLDNITKLAYDFLSRNGWVVDKKKGFCIELAAATNIQCSIDDLDVNLLWEGFIDSCITQKTPQNAPESTEEPTEVIDIDQLTKDASISLEAANPIGGRVHRLEKEVVSLQGRVLELESLVSKLMKKKAVMFRLKRRYEKD